MIDNFHAPGYEFLSNFYPADVWGLKTAEHAYQAAKFPENSPLRLEIEHADTPGQAKRLSRKAAPRDGFMGNRLAIMEAILRDKFKDPLLALRLIQTFPHGLVEGNKWHDVYWGRCTCGNCPEGENNLGKLLMKIRSELMSK